jgi:hypothetical protein
MKLVADGKLAIAPARGNKIMSTLRATYLKQASNQNNNITFDPDNIDRDCG